MNKALILKIAVFITVPLLVMIIAMFFLYPYLNEDKYQKVVQEHESKLAADFESNITGITEKPDSLSTEVDSLRGLDSVAVQNLQLALAEKDSLQSVVDSLMAELAKQHEIQKDEGALKAGNTPSLSAEDFADRVKSLLNLEEAELGPILEKMTKEQLVRLYNGGGTIQREKILRALNSDKAAELITEIML